MDWSRYQFHSCPNWEIAFHASNMPESLCIHWCCNLIILSYAWYIPECLLHVLPGRHLGMPLPMSLRVRSTLAMARDVFWDDPHQFRSTQLPFISISRVFPCMCSAALFLSTGYYSCLRSVLKLCRTSFANYEVLYLRCMHVLQASHGLHCDLYRCMLGKANNFGMGWSMYQFQTCQIWEIAMNVELAGNSMRNLHPSKSAFQAGHRSRKLPKNISETLFFEFASLTWTASVHSKSQQDCHVVVHN